MREPVTERPARLEEIAYLQKRLAEKPKNEQPDLRQCIVFVSEYQGRIVGMVAAYPMWRVEPLMLFDEFKKTAPKNARRRVTLGLIQAIEGWLADRSKNRSGVYSFFGFITDRVMQKLAVSYKMTRLLTGGKFFAKDL